MGDRLFVAVLGHRNSGKSTTWNTLFGRTVRTGKNARPLDLYDEESAEVFLISGSPEERDEYAGDILKNQNCRIILCSIQYLEDGLLHGARSKAVSSGSAERHRRTSWLTSHETGDRS